jgi:hypothetical protein
MFRLPKEQFGPSLIHDLSSSVSQEGVTFGVGTAYPIF